MTCKNPKTDDAALLDFMAQITRRENCHNVAESLCNEIADGHYRSDAERAEWEAQIEKLNAQCRAKGGKV